MEDLFDALLFGDDLSSEERSRIEGELADDASLARAWARWCHVRRHLRGRLKNAVSNRELLVLYVLDQDGYEQALTPRERAILSDTRDEIDQAVDSNPALRTIVERIRDEQSDFDEVWEDHVNESDDGVEAGDRTPSMPLRSERPDRADRSPRSRKQTRRRQWMGRLVTAGLIVLLAVLTVLYLPREETGATITVAEGNTKVTELVDGSTVRLVGPAALSHRMADDTGTPRRVVLKRGRAFFDVQQREEAPFVVTTSTARATVLGTEFGVSTRADTTKIVLAEGSVRLASVAQDDGRGVVLEPGQRSWVAGTGSPATPESVDLTSELKWTGLFVFRSVPLETIGERLQQRYDVEVTIADPLHDATVTGTFEREQPVEEVLTALAATLGARVEQHGEATYRLVPSE